MSYRFRKHESVTSAIRRIVRAECDDAVEELQSVRKGRIKGIHEARKCIKKIRAALRLVQSKLGESFGAANKHYRDISRQLSGPRDAEAVIEAHDKLVAAVYEPELDDGFRRLRELLVTRRDETLRQCADFDSKVTELAERVRSARAETDQWTIRPNGYAAVARGLKRAYRRGRRAMVEAYRSPTDVHFHEWRKEVKAHWYHVRLLRGVWPKVMIALEAELGMLAELLGDDHDLAVLRDLLAAQEGRDPAMDVKAMLKVIRGRRQQIRRAARSLAQRLYVEKPSQMSRRLERCWNAWHRQDGGLEEFGVTGPGDQAEPAAQDAPPAGAPSAASRDDDTEQTATAAGDDNGAPQDEEESPVVASIHIVADSRPRSSSQVS